MNLGRVISVRWTKFKCWALGHTNSVVCLRCGRLVDLNNNHSVLSRWKWNMWNGGVLYHGSVRVRPGMICYSLNVHTNELRRLGVKERELTVGNDSVELKKEAEYDPMCVYLEAVNDKNAIRKANNFMFSVKSGVRIKEISK